MFCLIGLGQVAICLNRLPKKNIARLVLQYGSDKSMTNLHHKKANLHYILLTKTVTHLCFLGMSFMSLIT